jgi:hypothetical protein
MFSVFKNIIPIKEKFESFVRCFYLEGQKLIKSSVFISILSYLSFILFLFLFAAMILIQYLLIYLLYS